MAVPRPPRPDAAADEVARIAAAAPDWATLAATARSCVACPELAAVRQHVVVGDVPVSSSVAPGASPTNATRGRSGALLDQLLAEAGLDRAECAVLNGVKCRPPANRTPKAPEVARCSGWLHRQLELLDPPAVVALGLSAAKFFLGPRTVLGEARGRPHRIDGRDVWATYHPSAAIRFGPNGAPRAALLADLVTIARSVQ